MTSDEIQKVQELLGGFRFAMLTTRDHGGALTAHPMTVQEAEFDGDLWFIVGETASAIEHIANDSAVGVSFSDSSSWLSISGTASVIHDPERLRELWNPAVEAWFPEGPDDSKATLVKVAAEGAQYWDSPGRVATLLSLVKSKVTGEPYEGDSAKVDLA